VQWLPRLCLGVSLWRYSYGWHRESGAGHGKFLGGLNSFYLLVDEPEVYGLPRQPRLPSRSVRLSSLLSVASAVLMALGALISFRRRGEREET
jgi:formate dehydrogenase iron-sulfur subunit